MVWRLLPSVPLMATLKNSTTDDSKAIGDTTGKYIFLTEARDQVSTPRHHASAARKHTHTHTNCHWVTSPRAFELDSPLHTMSVT